MTAPFAGGRIVLVRHASAGSRDGFGGDDRERPLDARGRRQAAALPGHLAAYGLIERPDEPGPGQRPDAALVLVSSPLVRCRATLEPLAEVVGAPIALDEDLAEGEPPLRSEDGWPDAAWLGTRAVRALDRVAAAAEGATVIVCSHGELLPAALATVAARSDRDVPGSIDLTAKALPKGAAWLLDPARSDDWVTEIPAPDA